MFKNFWFQTHWLFGITAGIVLAVMGVTGALLSFEQEILRLLNPSVMTVEAEADLTPLGPGVLMARAAEAAPDKRVIGVGLNAEPTLAAQVVYAGGRRGEPVYINPYTGELLGKPERGDTFLHVAEDIHRWLALGDVGKAITGASTLILVVLALSGLYLRWPRNAASWRAWLTLDLARKGRSFLWDLHAVAGTWVLAIYLLAALTGLYWSYDWYRNALFELTGAPRPTQMGGPGGQAKPGAGPRADGRPGAAARPGGEGGGAGPAVEVAQVWAVFQREVPAWSSVNLRLPERPGAGIELRYLDADPAHERASNTLTLDAKTLAVTKHERYADLAGGAKLMRSVFVLHKGSYFGTAGTVLVMLASLGMPLFAITGWMLYLDRRGKKRAARAAARTVAPAAVVGKEPLLIGFASQSGFAEQLAWQTAGTLQAAGVPVAVHPLAELEEAVLKRFRQALFVVSTFGDGQAPDAARPFVRRIMSRSLSMPWLRYGVLALGDRQYATFCGFGKALADWLHRQGAEPLFAPVEVDDGDPAALSAWQGHLGRLAGADVGARWTAPAYGRWRLTERRLLNPGSQGEPMYHLALVPADGAALDWQSGDIADVIPRHAEATVQGLLREAGLDGATEVQVDGKTERLDAVLARRELPAPGSARGLSAQALVEGLKPVHHRHYSIASVPEDGALWLLVRQARLGGGGLGFGSGWLTEHAPLGSEIELRARANQGFRLEPADRPLILIGNGSGLSSLRAHLKARSLAGRGRNWLVFGERNADRDFYYREELETWLRAGVLSRLDRAFSRDQAERVYVQQRLREAAEELCAWVADGAAIYVCGSAEGMAPAVEQTLAELLGEAALERLSAEGRYRRDVY